MTSVQESPEQNSSSSNLLSWLVIILVPVILVLSGVRLMMSGVFLKIEYNLPGFPADRYGFTTADRMYWAEIAVDYLLNPAGIEFLADLRFEDGSPVYNERELKHMVDVKNVVNAAMSVWLISLGGLLLLTVWARNRQWVEAYKAGLRRGGWLTVILVGLIIFFVLISFGVFFVAFHNVFFEPGTWVFYYSDTLIRLFPERFWRDIFIFVGGFAVLGGLGLALGFRRKV
jgi:integral membrane protein (TIGR01906 family)